MLVTTFKNDIKQFQMFCYCMNKNWKGKRELTVCIGSCEKSKPYWDIVNTMFDQDWKIKICPSVDIYQIGVTEQQVNTVYYSIDTGADDVIVWDCKDFLLRPCDYNTFKKDHKYRITYHCQGEKLVDMGYDLNGLVDQPIDYYTTILNIRPWVWNVQQLKKYWDRLQERFGHYHTWGEYPAGNEIYGYYIFTLQDPTSTVEFASHEETPLLFGGGYTHQTYEAMLKEVGDFEKNTDRVVWKHSRKLEDPRCLEVTRQVLDKYGIDKEIVEMIYGKAIS